MGTHHRERAEPLASRDARGAAGRAARVPATARKYFMVSADCHANEPTDLWVERIDEKYRDRLPRVDHRQERRAVARVRGPPPGPAAPLDDGRRGPARAKAGADPPERLPTRTATASMSR